MMRAYSSKRTVVSEYDLRGSYVHSLKERKAFYGSGLDHIDHPSPTCVTQKPDAYLSKRVQAISGIGGEILSRRWRWWRISRRWPSHWRASHSWWSSASPSRSNTSRSRRSWTRTAASAAGRFLQMFFPGIVQLGLAIAVQCDLTNFAVCGHFGRLETKEGSDFQ